ncbi:MAG: hypothetical protein QOI66_2432 [Myxococcales bacterium]|jgi:hypothetical protein|nr:hypothetical protein [Myxococcales bacterium]
MASTNRVYELDARRSMLGLRQLERGQLSKCRRPTIRAAAPNTPSISSDRRQRWPPPSRRSGKNRPLAEPTREVHGPQRKVALVNVQPHPVLRATLCEDRMARQQPSIRLRRLIRATRRRAHARTFPGTPSNFAISVRRGGEGPSISNVFARAVRSSRKTATCAARMRKSARAASRCGPLYFRIGRVGLRGLHVQ